MRSLVQSIAALAVTSALGAQRSAYTPSTELPHGREIVALYIGAHSCGPCHAPEVKDAVRKMKLLAAEQAKKSGAAFSVMGVANGHERR
jgi:hypothetical protein